MSTYKENEHPRDKQGKFIDKHVSAKPNLVLPGEHEEEYVPCRRSFNSTKWGGFAMSPTRLALSNNLEDRIKAAERGQPADFDVLKDDSSPLVRRIVAEHGAHLDYLADDSDVTVRMAVAAQGASDRDMLSCDPDPRVRAIVARYGRWKYCNQLIGDPDPLVRASVARYGTPEQRDRLVNDPDPRVRAAVVRYGDEKYLDIFGDDTASQVRDAVGDRWSDINDQIDEEIMRKRFP